ncbi:MAG: hypothetical protein U5N26_07365 [Candidatus Marinimicrobia bacterium]|nr:hypothetical protein [Candidatus Neomarinimicrobiota bacterium]
MKKLLFTVTLLFFACAAFAQEADTLRFTGKAMKSPALATGLSAVFPGGGQIYNGKWGKGLIFMSGECALGATAAYYYLDHSRYSSQASLDNAKRFTWFFAAVYVYSLIDAYVDAHLSAFPDERLILEPDERINGVQLSYIF